MQQWFQTNAQGVLNIIFATEDASCHKVRADAFRPAKSSEDSGEVRLLDVPALDPTCKLVPKLEGINSPQDLRNARTQAGELLISTDTPEKDVEQGAAAIKLLREQIKEFNNTDEKAIYAAEYSSFSIWGDAWDWAGEKLHWLSNKVEDAWDWTVEKFGEVNPKHVKLTDG